MILLDTDIMVDVLRGYEHAITWLESIRNEEIGLPGLVAMELIQGCLNADEQRRIEIALRPYPIYWPTHLDCTRALADFAAFRLSHQLGLLDSLIAETALGLGAVLATFNIKHYRVVSTLQILQPYTKTK